MIRTLDGRLAPLSDDDATELRKIKAGAVVECKVVRKRNPDYHRRYFALLAVGFDAWSETAPTVEYKGQRVMPSRDRFRRDVAILAGYYTPVFNIKGELRMEAKSISFANMEQDEFERLFSATIDVLLTRILTAKGYTEQSLREHVERVLAFD